MVAAVKPGRLIDLGCNTGDYSALALAHGAGTVIGFDFDLDEGLTANQTVHDHRHHSGLVVTKDLLAHFLGFVVIRQASNRNVFHHSSDIGKTLTGGSQDRFLLGVSGHRLLAHAALDAGLA